MWNDVCVDRGQDAIHGCSVVILTAGGGSEAAAGKFHALRFNTQPAEISTSVCIFSFFYIKICVSENLTACQSCACEKSTNIFSPCEQLTLHSNKDHKQH